tara:strand:- start:7 stop:540 length:534 start_codon:yes stop_codon:yes gene_type:complete
MGTKISQMTLTGSAPVTSEVAIAYNGENYKINPSNLVSGGGSHMRYIFGKYNNVNNLTGIIGASTGSTNAFSTWLPAGNGIPCDPTKTYIFMGHSADADTQTSRAFSPVETFHGTTIPVSTSAQNLGNGSVQVAGDTQGNGLLSMIVSNKLYLVYTSSSWPTSNWQYSFNTFCWMGI